MSPLHRGAAALLAATVVNLPFGTLYAFSVFLKPMEALGATRAEMGFVFGLATVTLTVGMNFAPQLYRRLSPVTLALACGLTSGLGPALAASASGFAQFAQGYGLFGPGAGVRSSSRSRRVAGRLYIAWCSAAVGLLVLAGALFAAPPAMRPRCGRPRFIASVYSSDASSSLAQARNALHLRSTSHGFAHLNS